MRSFSNYPHGQNRPDLGEVICYQSNQRKVMRNKTCIFHPYSSLLGLISLLYSLPLPPQWQRRRGMEVVVHSSHVVSAAPSSSGRGLLAPFSFFSSVLSSVLASTGLPKSLLQSGLPTASLHLMGIPLLWAEVSPWAAGDFCSTVVPQGHSYLTLVCTTGCWLISQLLCLEHLLLH